MGLDVTSTIVGRTGVARYAQMLWQELAGFDDIEVRAFGAGRGEKPQLPARVLRVPLRVLYPVWRFTGRPRAESLVGDVDVVHSIDLLPPPTRRPLVMTIHDAFAITHPHLVPHRARVLQLRQLKAAASADAVVTTCHATARVLSELTPIPPGRIVVAELGGPAATVAIDESPIEGEYVLAVGAVSPRKGLETLAAAIGEMGPGAPQVLIAGPDGWKAEEVRRRVADLDPHGRVRFLGAVSDASLAALYRHAMLFCHPSLAEGFGIPCVEAMTYGCAIVATDLPSIREITDGSAVLVTADDASALASALHELVRDEQRRGALGAAASERAKQYTWRRMAEGVVDAYRLALR